MNLSDKVALVTGGSMGIGAAIALEFARLGAHIAIVARQQGPEASSVIASIESLGRKSLFIQGDMSRENDCLDVVARTADHFGRLDVLVHNAGGPAPGKIDEISSDAWRYTIDLHLSANFWLCRAALNHLRKQPEGAIVTVSSTAGKLGVPGALAYATAKGALPQFTRSLARDLADDNIRVNCVAPGVIRTRFHDGMPPERVKLNLEQRIPLHREGTPAQVAEVVAMLVTNDYITGETVTVDGGLTMRIA